MEDKSSKSLMGYAHFMEKLMPHLKLELKQAYIKDSSEVYLAKILVTFVLVLVFFNAVLIQLFIIGENENIWLAVILGTLPALFMFYYRLKMPRMKVMGRVKDIERNLAFAAQSLYVQVSSGVPVFNSIVSIANGKYGAISSEFKVAVKEIESGEPLVTSLEGVARRNPSPYFQRVMWQMVNTLKTGGDLAANLDDIVKNISRDQVSVIKTYGARLSPLSMAYMMVAVIVPSLGVTVLITLSSLPSMGARLDEPVFWGIFLLAAILQLQFAMIIKSIRPNLVGD